MGSAYGRFVPPLISRVRLHYCYDARTLVVDWRPATALFGYGKPFCPSEMLEDKHVKHLTLTSKAILAREAARASGRVMRQHLLTPIPIIRRWRENVTGAA